MGSCFVVNLLDTEASWQSDGTCLCWTSVFQTRGDVPTAPMSSTTSSPFRTASIDIPEVCHLPLMEPAGGVSLGFSLLVAVSQFQNTPKHLRTEYSSFPGLVLRETNIMSS